MNDTLRNAIEFAAIATGDITDGVSYMVAKRMPDDGRRGTLRHIGTVTQEHISASDLAKHCARELLKAEERIAELQAELQDARAENDELEGKLWKIRYGDGDDDE